MTPPKVHPATAVLQELYRASNMPSARQLAFRLNVSHTTVANALNGVTIPTQKTFNEIVKALGGDPEMYANLYERPTVVMPAQARTVSHQVLEELRAIRQLLERLLPNETTDETTDGEPA